MVKLQSSCHKEARKTGKIQILKLKFFIHGFLGS